ncbi:unnamed protein product [Adineta steineri]|uniref:A-kinase anchor protein 7-like phosphoesterase domain-containing protein n=1 Tax=Adineta steineri TaxID=433720 RepID=A0A819HD41_9BILA|nr:unnamed protein product [Adineta steineri]CAF3899937.1 unnamed protein product [Adineta steineri]
MSEELSNIYNKLYIDAIEKIKSDQYVIDHMIDSPLDKRYGLALIIKLDQHVKQQIQTFLSALHAIEPDQYYLPSSDIHITLLPIISCSADFDLNQIFAQDYIDLLRKNLSIEGKLEINFKGITASSSCIMIQGFPQQNILNELRNQLRTLFKTSSLRQTIEERYFLQTAHVTVVRFRKAFTAREEFLKLLEDYKDYDFGTMTVNEIELVYHDWYVREKIVKSLCRFKV